MNNKRRKLLQKLVDSIDTLRSSVDEPSQGNSLATELANLKMDFDFIRSDEQEAFDNLPESLQESERGTAAQEVIDKLDEPMALFDEIEDALSTVSQTLGSLYDALEEAAQ